MREHSHALRWAQSPKTSRLERDADLARLRRWRQCLRRNSSGLAHLVPPPQRCGNRRRSFAEIRVPRVVCANPVGRLQKRAVCRAPCSHRYPHRPSRLAVSLQRLAQLQRGVHGRRRVARCTALSSGARNTGANGNGPQPLARDGQNDHAIALGRRNWLFADTVTGAKASAAIYSLVETAKANGLEPFAYLRELFTTLPLAKTVADFEALLPFNSKSQS